MVFEKTDIEIHHGGKFKFKEGVYCYQGGKVEPFHQTSIDFLCLQAFENFLTKDIGYSSAIKIYYKKHEGNSMDDYQILWNDDGIRELIEYAQKHGIIKIYVDHQGEKGEDIDDSETEYSLGNTTKNDRVENFVDMKFDGESESDPDYVGGDDESSVGNESESGDGTDEEFEEIKKTNRLIAEGKIDPLRDDNLTNMPRETVKEIVDVDAQNNVAVGSSGKQKIAQDLGEQPVAVVGDENEVGAGNSQVYEDNIELTCDRIEKNLEEDEDTDSRSSCPSPKSTDSSDNDSGIQLKPEKKKKDKAPQYPTFNPNIKPELIEFEVGMMFTSRAVLKEAIINYGVAQQRRVYMKRNDRGRIQAKCKDGCTWDLWASRVKWDLSFQIKSYTKQHNCIIVSKQRIVKAEWLAKRFGNTIRSNPRWKLKEFMDAIKDKYRIVCIKNQCWWAKKLAMAELENVLNEHYSRLWDYGAEVLRTNAGSSLFIKGEVSEESSQPTFQRLYMCFDALKKGFLQGCRKVIGLDGCFLKGYVKGELLSAVGRDGNNQMFPIAWAVVDVECTEAWIWFIQLLQDDLQLGDGTDYTIITDKQKGLKNAIDELLPNAEHRCCARHIYANWRKNHLGHALKCAFWKAAKASTVPDFNLAMDEIRSISPFAYNDLLKTNPKYWSRSYFRTNTHCEIVDNNLSECFNSWILEARYKPIISMLDHIRLQCMERIHTKRDYMSRIDTELCPRIIRRLNFSIEGSKLCSSVWDGGVKAEVNDKEGNKFEVDMRDKICSCRKWQLTGVPCAHACQALMALGDAPDRYVDDCFKKSTYMRTYSHLMCPVKGSKDWPITVHPKLLPPKARRMPGRPKKHRRKEAGEEGAGTKLGKKGIAIKCSRCLIIGHNKSTCKTPDEVVAENHRKAEEAKKAESEAVKAHSLRNKQNVRKNAKVSKGGSSTVGTTTDTSLEPVQKKKRGRPPKDKTAQSQSKKKPASIGLLVSDDGQSYLSSPNSTIRLTSSQPINTTTRGDETTMRTSSSQPTVSPRKSSGPMMRNGKSVLPRSEF